jgi:hypothetical protein
MMCPLDTVDGTQLLGRVGLLRLQIAVASSLRQYQAGLSTKVDSHTAARKRALRNGKIPHIGALLQRAKGRKAQRAAGEG